MNKFLYLSEKDVDEIVKDNYDVAINAVTDALMMMANGSTIQPDKSSQIFDDFYQNRINCMASTLKNENVCGVKWVSVFPSNKEKGLKNVEGFTSLSEIETGSLICFMNATKATSLRTAAMGAIAAKYLAKQDATSIGFIGAGEEAKAHLNLIKYTIPTIKTCYVSSRTDRSTSSFVNELQTKWPDITFVDCHNKYGDAVVNADIIVTAISSQEKVLKANWIKDGALYIHVAGLEDEFAVAKKASKIVCDCWDCVKHRAQTITQMYHQGILKEDDIYADISEISEGKKRGRENNKEFIYFNSVGLSVEDVLLCDRIYKLAIKNNIGTWINK